ncbi:ABC transporter substrate-binding protein [Rhodopila sp.]|uniref:ABC transporter substrate-binding protein n=1 Tax=Rhodopila sp. TaxID=2480087 RepID=UPI003D145863
MPLTRRLLMTGAAAAPLAAMLPGRSARADPSVLRYGLQVYPPSFLPWQQSGTSAATVNVCVRRGLLSYGKDGALRGELAEHWEADGQGWRFNLREATFHNGKRVTAADVKWSIEQMTSPKSTAYLRGSMQHIVSVETPDDMTVRLITRQPVVSLPYWFAMPHAPIISRDSPDAGVGAIGAGPFVMTSNERGIEVRLASFPQFYRAGLPKLKELRMTVYADENLRVSALQAGDLDMIEYVPWQSIDTIAASPKLKMDSTNGPFMYVVFNGASGPFQDARVRQAVALGIKREDVAKAAFYGHAATLGGMPIPAASPYYNEKLAHVWTYDPARAKQLLAEAGVGGGFSCTLLSNITNGMHKSTAEVMQQNLADIGIQVQLALPDWANFLTLANRGQYEFAINGTTLDSNDPDSLTSLLDGSQPPGFMRSTRLPTPELTKLLTAGRTEFDQAKRKAIYDQVQQLALEQVPACFLVLRTQAYAMRQAVQGFRNLPGQLTFYSGYTLEDVDLT